MTFNCITLGYKMFNSIYTVRSCRGLEVFGIAKSVFAHFYPLACVSLVVIENSSWAFKYVLGNTRLTDRIEFVYYVVCSQI